jgi:hypothetical protein
MQRYRHKTKREAYKTMDWCRAERSEGKISIEPHDRRPKPEEWKWLPPESKVVIPATTDATIAGAAVRWPQTVATRDTVISFSWGDPA